MRDVKKMEGYQMFAERYVQFVSPGIFPETDKHCFVIAHVKPRTNEKDPISKLPYYKLWIIFDKHDLHTSIYSANCSCKGGSDGYCRHVVATIFELMDFIDDSKKKSVTSGKCQWIRRSARISAPTPIENLEIGLQM